MKNKLTLTETVSIKAPKAKVWEAITNPDIIRKYFFGTNTVTDWKVGSPIYWRGEWEGKSYEDKGTILVNEFQKQIQYSYWSSFSGKPDIPENYATVTYILDEESGATLYTVIQDNIESEEARKHSEQNWKMILEDLRKLVEKKEEESEKA